MIIQTLLHQLICPILSRVDLWNVYGDCENYNVIEGHKNAVLDVHWTYDSTQIISASADKTIGLWDATVSLHEYSMNIEWD